MLRVESLNVNYGLRRAISSVDLEVPAGKVVALLGPNGAGKTTLLKALSGLLPVKSGRVLLAGQDISNLRPDLRVRRGLVQVPEGGGVFAPLTVLDNLLLACRLQRRQSGDKSVQRSLQEVYSLFPILAKRSTQSAGSLSGGERQMLAIARGLLTRPQVLMLDEPSLGLAPRVMDEIFAVLGRMGAEGLTILLVEQNVRQAMVLADLVYVLDRGQIREHGPKAQFVDHVVWDRVFLGRAANG